MKFEHGFCNGDDPALECPRCGGNNLHQGRVEIFERGEDADTCFEVVVAADSSLSAKVGAGKGNPSRRRHGMRIYMACEGCDIGDDKGYPLAIVQHKGGTYIYWDDGDDL